jgi:hypothetical protein
MKMSSETFGALLLCPAKAYLVSRGFPAEERQITRLISEYEHWLREVAVDTLRHAGWAERVHIGMPPLEAFADDPYSLVLGCDLAGPSYAARLDGFTVRKSSTSPSDFA